MSFPGHEEKSPGPQSRKFHINSLYNKLLKK